jgi:hypothetical protein
VTSKQSRCFPYEFEVGDQEGSRRVVNVLFPALNCLLLLSEFRLIGHPHHTRQRRVLKIDGDFPACRLGTVTAVLEYPGDGHTVATVVPSEVTVHIVQQVGQGCFSQSTPVPIHVED